MEPSDQFHISSLRIGSLSSSTTATNLLRFMLFLIFFSQTKSREPSQSPSICHLVAAAAAAAELQGLDSADTEALKAIRSWLRDVPAGGGQAGFSASSFFESWNFSLDPCSFEGVLCDHSFDPARVVSLNLGSPTGSSPGLRGRLHPAIGSLSALVQISLSPGKVSGPIPSSLSQLSKLQNLGLSHNLLHGSIPPGLGSLSSLLTLDLSFNRLSGTLPHSLASLPNLISLSLAHNRLHGSLPPSFAGALALEQIDLRRNLFLGALPTRLPPLLKRFSLSHNKLTGTLDPLLSVPQLTFLDLSRNELSGMIPAQLFSLSDLSYLLLSHNRLDGEVMPTEVVAISTIDLSFNELRGSISPLFASVENLYLNNNRFTGIVPAEFREQLLAAAMKTLFLQHNFLTGFPPVAAGSLPLTASLCICYNCMPPLMDSLCPKNAGSDPTRPSDQCNFP